MAETTVDWEQVARERDGIWYQAIAERDEARAENARLRAELDLRWEYAKTVPGLIEQATSMCAQENARLQVVAEAAQGVLNTVEVSDHDSRGMPASAKVRYTRIVMLERALAALDKETQ